MPSTTWIFCADIGSVKNGRFGWFGCSLDGQQVPGSTIEDLERAVTEKLNSGAKVALGFECPLFVPLRNEPSQLTNARNGEGNRPWSAGAGCGALATGLVEVTWLLEKIRRNTHKPVNAFIDWKAFKKAGRGLFLWEAFVSGKAKGKGHAHDAEIAVQLFLEALPDPLRKNAIKEESVLSIVGAIMLRTGWSKSVQILSKPCLVIKA